MRCKKCGGVLHFLLIDVLGIRYYQCHTNLTTVNLRSQRGGFFTKCGEVYNEFGVAWHNFIAYNSEGKQRVVSYDELKGGK